MPEFDPIYLKEKFKNDIERYEASGQPDTARAIRYSLESLERAFPTETLPAKPQPSGVLTVSSLPSNLQSGDVIFVSPSGELRGQPERTRLQRVWMAVDRRMRKWLNII